MIMNVSMKCVVGSVHSRRGAGSRKGGSVCSRIRQFDCCVVSTGADMLMNVDVGG